MKKQQNDPDMRPEYDFSGGVRGKYTKRYAEGTNVVVVDPDVVRRRVADGIRIPSLRVSEPVPDPGLSGVVVAENRRARTIHFSILVGVHVFCRKKARQSGVKMRTLDQALWKYSKLRQRT